MTFLVTQLEKESDKDDTSPKILALLSAGIAKLLITGMISDEKVSPKQYRRHFFNLQTLEGGQESDDGVLLAL